jgi:hypothetical protein
MIYCAYGYARRAPILRDTLVAILSSSDSPNNRPDLVANSWSGNQRVDDMDYSFSVVSAPHKSARL